MVETSNLRELSEQLDRCLLMGVLNATTDSFFDGGKYPDLDSRLEHAERLISEGADVLDVGGQSAITGVPETDPAVEIQAICPIISQVRAQHPDLPISVDTYKPPVAEAALEAGATIVNDTSGLKYPEVAEITAAAEATLVVMHNRSAPKERLTNPHLYDDVMQDVREFLDERIEIAVAAGLGMSRSSSTWAPTSLRPRPRR